DPPGTPGPTMKSLDDVPPVWSQILPANDGSDSCHSSRFSCVMGNVAVLDRETGLVWQRSPSLANEGWYGAVFGCVDSPLGGRYGWRLPEIEELRSLLDSTGTFQAGHPFTSASLTDFYWSSSTKLDDSTRVYAAAFFPASLHVVDGVKSGNTL